MAKVVEEKRKPKQPRRSTETPSLWRLGGLSAKEFGKRLWTEMDTEHDDVFGRAAELAYYFFFALFPGLFFALSLVGLIAGNNPELQTTMFSYAARVLPPAALQLVQKTVSETTQTSHGWKLLAGALGALWAASAGTSSLMTVLNFVHHVKEHRPLWKARLVIAPLLTVALAALMMTALFIVLFGGLAANWTGAHGLGDAAVLTWKIAQWPIALFFVVLAFAVLYFWAPSVEEQKWYWITPGSLLGVALWLAASGAFRIYLHYFNSYSATYGSLGAAIILLLWFYITGLALLIGDEINAEIESAAAEHGRADAKLKGEKEAPAA